jgi:hypothetical protein
VLVSRFEENQCLQGPGISIRDGGEDLFFLIGVLNQRDSFLSRFV